MPLLTETFSMPGNTFGLLRDLIQARMGVYYANGKSDLLAGKLSPLVAARKLDSFLDYYFFLKYDPASSAEWQRVESALAVNETWFWREATQIKAAAESIVPQLQRQRPNQPVRIWHAGCASGEEPYTMVMALLENARYLQGEIEIQATDANRQALARAKEAIYRKRSFRGIDPEMIERHFLTSDGYQHQLHNRVHKRVRFSYLNLMDAQSMNTMRGFDILFCRNVFIYFSQENISFVAEHFYQALNPGGILFIGASESLLRITTLFDFIDVKGAIGYRKPE